MTSLLQEKTVGALSIDENIYGKQKIIDMADKSIVTWVSVGEDHEVLDQVQTQNLSVLLDEQLQQDYSSQKHFVDKLHLLKSNTLNAFNKPIRNVATPVDATDAATKGYVDDKLSTFESEMYFFYSKTPYYDQAIAYKGDVNFGKMVDFYMPVEKIKLYQLTLWSHPTQSGLVSSGTEIAVVKTIGLGGDYELVGTSLPLPEDVGANSPIKFDFQTPLEIDVMSNYQLSVVDSLGNQRTIGVEFTLNPDAIGNYSYGKEHTWSWQFYIYQLKATITQNTMTGMIIPNSANASEKFKLFVENGNLKVQKIE